MWACFSPHEIILYVGGKGAHYVQFTLQTQKKLMSVCTYDTCVGRETEAKQRECQMGNNVNNQWIGLKCKIISYIILVTFSYI